MNENDAMRLLADANPIRAEDLHPLNSPPLTRRRAPSRPLFLAIALVVATAAASLIGVFAFGSSTRHLVRGGSMLVPPPTLAHPLPPGAQQVSLSDAAQALGASIVLPNNALAGPSNVGAVWTHFEGPVTDIAVTFPGPGLIVDYERPVPYPQPVAAMYETLANEHSDSMRTIDLNGVPALAIAQNSDQLHHNFGAIEFVENGTVIRVMGHHDEATLQAVAQSIVGRGGSATVLEGFGSLPTVAHPLPPTAKQISLADAAAAIGRPIVLPDTSVVSPSDAGPVWINGARPAVTAAVTFPSQGVFIQYTLPSPHDPAATYRAIAREDPKTFRTIDMDGRTALAGQQNPDDRNLAVLTFVLNDVEISVFGPYDESTLQAIVQSIVDRSG